MFQLETKYEECVDDEILVYLPLMEFLKLVDNFQKVILLILLNSCTLTLITRLDNNTDYPSNPSNARCIIARTGGQSIPFVMSMMNSMLGINLFSMPDSCLCDQPNQSGNSVVR